MRQEIPEETILSIEDMRTDRVPLEEIAIVTGVSYSTVYIFTKLQERGFGSRKKYMEHLARSNGFESYEAYRNQLHQKKKQKKDNLTQLIRWLEKTGNQGWIAGQVGLTRQSICSYANQNAFPRSRNFRKLYELAERIAWQSESSSEQEP